MHFNLSLEAVQIAVVFVIYFLSVINDINLLLLLSYGWLNH